MDHLESAARQSDAAADLAKKRLADTRLDAPISGIIARRTIEVGATVAQGQSVYTIVALDPVRVRVGVPEADVGAIQEGAEASFTVSTWPGHKFTGKIVRLSHLIDPKTRTMSVELDVANTADKPLTPGAYAEVLWPVHRDQPSLFVPATAIVQTTEKTYVDRVRDGAIEQVAVQRGVAAGDLVEVFGALAAGDQVLRRGSETLQPGAKVTTKPAQ